jgi:hypothetical protein
MVLLYVWDASIPGDREATRELLAFAKQRAFNALAIEASPLGYGQPGAAQRYRDFVQLAHLEGFRVLGLAGYPWFTVSAQAGVPEQPTAHEEGWELYRSVLASGLFDGILDDSSPFETDFVDATGAAANYFWDQPERALQDYLDWLRGLQSLAGSKLHVQAVPLWFDTRPELRSLVLDGEEVPHSLCWYVARHVDVMNVLAYRDRAEAILEGVAVEVNSTRVLVGVETEDLGRALDPVTFFEEGTRTLQRELGKVWNRLQRHPNFQGVSVHHYGGLQALERYERSRNSTRR